MARRSKKRSTKIDDKPVKKSVDTSLHDGNLTKGLEVPNHMVPIMLDNDPAERTALRWPMVMATRKTTDDEFEAGEKRQLMALFIAPNYPVDHWTEWIDNPPSWMDPHLLARMAEKCSEPVRQLLKKGFDKNTTEVTPQLKTALMEIFEKVYVPYMRKKLESEAARFIADWMLVHSADKRLESGAVKKPRRRSPAAVEQPK